MILHPRRIQRHIRSIFESISESIFSDSICSELHMSELYISELYFFSLFSPRTIYVSGNLVRGLGDGFEYAYMS